MSNTVTNVTAGKPVVTGAIWRAPLSASPTIPTDATTSLSADYKCMGYVSDDGVTNSNSPSVEEIKAWGGDTVLTTQTEKPDTFQFTLIEALNLDVLAAVYGSGNVTGALATGVTVTATAEEPEEAGWVIEQVLRGGILKRIVIPDAKISDIGDITYTDDEAVGYDITLTAMPVSGATHKEYLIEDSSS